MTFWGRCWKPGCDIASCLKAAVSSLAPTPSSLISKGMVWSPDHGDTAFTVPMFDEFMKRQRISLQGSWPVHFYLPFALGQNPS